MEENGRLQTVTNFKLTLSEQKLLDVLLSPEFRGKSITDICNVAGLSRMAYYRAFAKSEFKEMYKEKAKELVDQAIAPVLNTFVNEALKGSFPHGKVILEMAGLYNEKSQVEFLGGITVTKEERQIRILEMLDKKQLKEAVPVVYEVLEEDEEIPDFLL